MAIELKDIDSWDLVRELRSRGFTTDLLFCLEDVDAQIKDVNEGLDEGEEKLELDEYEKQNILDDINFEYYIQRINEEIFDKVYDHKS